MSDVETHSPVRRRPPRRLALVALVVLAAVGVAGWWLAAEHRLDAVHVGLAPGGIRCDPGDVHVRDADPPQDVAMQVIATRPGMRCMVQLLVRNAGDAEVHLGELAVPVMGPEAAGTAQVVGVSPFGATPTEDDAPVDAIVDLDTDLPAGQVQEVLLHLEHRPTGCGGPGSLMTPGGPYLRVKALGRTAVREPALPPFSLEGGRSTDCSS